MLSNIVGHESDERCAAALHELRHMGRVEYLHVTSTDLERRRFRVTSDQGVDYAIALSRDDSLVDGAVLSLDGNAAVVVRAGAPRALRFRARTLPAAMRIGFLAGHLHWKSILEGDTLEVRLEGAESDYMDRVQDLVDTGAVELLAASDQ